MNITRRFWKVDHDTAQRRDLTPADKLVLACLRHHQGENDSAWPSMRTIARECGLSPGTVAASAHRLAEVTGLIAITKKKNAAGRWVNVYSVRSVAVRSVGEHVRSVSRTEKNKGKEPSESVRGSQSIFDEEAVKAIYLAYPRHVGRAHAMKAIRGALRRLESRSDIDDPAEWLLNRVKRYATSGAGQRGRFTPFPATWFNRESYDDADQEWESPREDPKARSTRAVGTPQMHETVELHILNK